MAEKQLIVAVEGTAAMGPFWQSIVSDYLDKIIRIFCATELAGQKPSASNVALSLVTFHAHGSYSACLVQRSGWTRDVDIFLHWLSAMPFAGGGYNDAAIAEGLAEAIMVHIVDYDADFRQVKSFAGDEFSSATINSYNMMFSGVSGSQTQQNVAGHRHCILVAASNPYPLPTPVYRPQVQNLEQGENIEAQTQSRLSDAETVAKSFGQGKRNPRAADPPVDNVKNPHFLVLISEDFMEARAALSRPGITGLASGQSPVKMDIASVPPVSAPPPTSVPPVNGSIMNRQPIPLGNIPPATVKVEPSTVSSMVSGPSFPHIQSVPRPTSQGVPSLQTSSPMSSSQEMASINDNIQDLKPIVSSMAQPLRPVGPAAANVSILNNLSQARQVMNSATLSGGSSIGLQSIGPTPMAMHMSNMISSGMSSSVPPAQTVLTSGQSVITSVAGSGTLTGTAQAAQNPASGSFTSATSNNMSGTSNLGMSQQLGNLQGGVTMGQSVPGMNQGNLPGPQMVQSGIGMNQNMMSGLGPSGISSGTGTMIPTPGMTQQLQPGMQSLGVNNSSGANMPMSQQTTSGLQSAQSKYVKVWEGNLSGQRQGQPVFITRLEGYRSASACETLAANWPPTMQIVRLISQDHMNNKQYVGKADFLVFRAMNQHGFLGQLQEKKLCAVIQLPSQTLLLSVSDKACRLIGMLFPGVRG
ncbi:hypothetical protein RHMOL_Rhmol09G0162600 [Rhododendron molle]|uniref:Uncharacterized protein n=1 Tax=Rhododendron molle TaxID=49168 RepID=A0ACC0MFR5_RHOML|nr:hypothetical protein RHMOL_Rhmol09G0162600 [Rhododendron molle]